MSVTLGQVLLLYTARSTLAVNLKTLVVIPALAAVVALVIAHHLRSPPPLSSPGPLHGLHFIYTS